MVRTGWGQVPRLGKTWEVAAWEIAHVRELGKIPLGSCHLGKILWESTSSDQVVQFSLFPSEKGEARTGFR